MGVSNPNSWQLAYKIGDNDNADPDNCNFDAKDTPRVGIVREAPFMVRIQVKNTGSASEVGVMQLFYNDEESTSGAVMVGAALDGTVQVDSADGLPADNATVNDKTVIEDLSGSYTWQNGMYDDGDGQTSKYSLLVDRFSDLQYCVQLTENAPLGKTYYFFLKSAGGLLNHYDIYAQVQTITGGPKGPLGHPLTGPFRGPI